MRAILNYRHTREMEERHRNADEAFALLDMINAEFQSDPMSVQCFDQRVVERVKACMAMRKRHEAGGIF